MPAIRNRAVDRARLLSPIHNPNEIARRLDHVDDHHVQALNEWVRGLRLSPELPVGAGATIPWFDPEGGGVGAGVLFLAQDPSRVATTTRFISPDNEDPTAQNTTLACREAGLPCEVRVHWNVFPWWVNIAPKGRPVDPGRPVQTYPEAMWAAAPWLTELTILLTKLRVIVLAGRQAQRGFDLYRAAGGRLLPGVETLTCPSPSSQAWNNVDRPTGTRNSELTIQAMRRAAAIVDR